MDAARAGRSVGQSHPVALTGIITLLGYAVIVGTFLGLVPGYPDIGLETSTLLSHLTAVFNAATVVLLALGWWLVRRGQIRAHQLAMVGAFVCILLFLCVYLLRVGGGGTKVFVGPQPMRIAYLAMLAIHILLSIVAVPLVLYVLILGLAYPISRLSATPHPRMGRIAAATWIVSLTLGILAYVLLEHVYAWEWAAG